MARDQVQLAAAGAVAVLHNVVALAGEVAARQLLADIAGGPVVQALTPA